MCFTESFSIKDFIWRKEKFATTVFFNTQICLGFELGKSVHVFPFQVKLDKQDYTIKKERTRPRNKSRSSSIAIALRSNASYVAKYDQSHPQLFSDASCTA